MLHNFNEFHKIFQGPSQFGKVPSFCMYFHDMSTQD